MSIKSSIVSDVSETYVQMKKQSRKTTPFLTKFEKTRALCIRAQQLANGAHSTLSKLPSNIRSVEDIAHEEFRQNKLPIIIRRLFPSGAHEDWPISELTYI